MRNQTVPALLIFAIILTLTSVAFPAAHNAVELDVSLSKPYLLADTKQTAYLKVSLTGMAPDQADSRAPINVAIVLDKSGSMQGEKIIRAREAAELAIERLNENDIVSIITYDSTVNVLLPATKVSDKEMIFDSIRKITANGSTALFAGVSKGAGEVRKFLSEERVNRVILLSDGIANVGPSSPNDLADLGASLIKEGISVTTIGLGLNYNEDLMTRLARRSDGNHAFVENANDLAKVFDYEFGELLTIVAQEIEIKIDCAGGIRPIRILGRDADIEGNTVTAYVNQICSDNEKYILLEIEVPPGHVDTKRSIASTRIKYADLRTNKSRSHSKSLSASFTGSDEVVKAETDRDVMVAAIEQIATERNDLALNLRDTGKIKEAQKVLLDNADYLNFNAGKLNSDKLKYLGANNDSQSKNLDPENWIRTRKDMREDQYQSAQQQGYNSKTRK
jgi:Ca-activated chloride channel homolog